MNNVTLISPTAVICNGLPLGSPQQAFEARPDLGFLIATAMLVYDRQQRAGDTVEQLALLAAGRSEALATANALAVQLSALQSQPGTPSA